MRTHHSAPTVTNSRPILMSSVSTPLCLCVCRRARWSRVLQRKFQTSYHFPCKPVSLYLQYMSTFSHTSIALSHLFKRTVISYYDDAFLMFTYLRILWLLNTTEEQMKTVRFLKHKEARWAVDSSFRILNIPATHSPFLRGKGRQAANEFF